MTQPQMAPDPLVRDVQRSQTATQITRVALTAIFVAVGVALSRFYVPVFGAKAFPTQSFLNVVGAAFLGPIYTVIAAFVIALVRNATGLGTPLGYLGSIVGALLAPLCYRAVLGKSSAAGSGPSAGRQATVSAGNPAPLRLVLAVLAAAVGEIVGTGVIAAIADAAIVFPAVEHKVVALTIFVTPFLIAAVTGSVAAVVALLALFRAGLRPGRSALLD